MGDRITVFTMLFLGSISCMTMSCSSGDQKPAVSKKKLKALGDDKPVFTEKKLKAPGTDTGLAKDLRLLRKTILSTNMPPVRVSSYDAIEAAKRVFGRLKLIGMSKEHVLWILGDPKTISDEGLPQKPGKDSPLIYRFVFSTKGYDGTVRFKDGRVTSVEFGLWAY